MLGVCRKQYNVFSILWEFGLYTGQLLPFENNWSESKTQFLLNVVYCIPCKTCSKVYVGQTSRLLATHLSEHKAAVKQAKIDVSAVAEHVWKLGHQVDFQSTSILDHKNNQFRRCALESWLIQRHPSFFIFIFIFLF